MLKKFVKKLWLIRRSAYLVYECPLSIDLARNYLMKPTTATGQDLDNLEKVCRHNANVARSFGILDLSKSWKMVSRLSNLLCENDMKALQDYNKKVLNN